MSGEFRDISASFMWEALYQARDDGQTRISQTLGVLYRAIYPLEMAVALHEASDSSETDLSLACFEHARAIEDAAKDLVFEVTRERQAVEKIVRAVALRVESQSRLTLDAPTQISA